MQRELKTNQKEAKKVSRLRLISIQRRAFKCDMSPLHEVSEFATRCLTSENWGGCSRNRHTLSIPTHSLSIYITIDAVKLLCLLRYNQSTLYRYTDHKSKR